MHDLVRDGLAARVRDYKHAWGGSMHNCTEIRITGAGRDALRQSRT